MILDDAIRETAKEMGLPIMFVRRTYKAYWKAVREYVMSLPLKEDLTDEEFLALRPNINIPSIGKLYVSLERYRKLKAAVARYEERVKTNKK